MNVELAAEIRFRCPHCQKLFCTDQTAFEGLKNNAEGADFQCTDCQKDFILTNHHSSSGLYETRELRKTQFANCPKCSALKPLGQDECPHCGVLESKFNEIQKVENPRLFQLNKAWQEILKDITVDKTHQYFLDQAQKQSALNFAAQKYNDLKKIMGEDPLIEKYLKQIEYRLDAHVKSQFLQSRSETPEAQQSLLASGRLFIFVALFGTFILIINKIKPLFPNLTGLVVAITVLSYGLWFLTRPSISKKN
ncbi:hypothetical protein CIK05_05400 [Bdellovibrio sp. qaytius]|nr:hypothetical protein CIK05_05400 [Bdellovibrio sp. qaytius]